MNTPLDPDEARRTEELYGPLTRSLRRLVDVTIRSEVGDADVRRAHRLIDEAAELLGSRLHPEPHPVRTTTEGRFLTWGNVAIGTRNAIAPPLDVHRDETGRVTTNVTLGPAYEGPAGHVHGGICALLLDHILGATAHRPGKPAVTGTLTIRYVAPTRLGPLHVEAWVDHDAGSKTIARGQISDEHGAVSVEAEGVFIRPRAKP
ncbi:PaaI family thioesterase [Mycobacterium sp. ITM-2016-00317]|uniref:PaaI family thioesterase n=1 Tax=Mycobacterium sp. ITM-2016-00317 TaxID=2099694 RepID=UPI000D4F5248|nr:PaaI family thioesterase [Mycobacterium sp. ITM-2016-00317]WNG89135.1 PaaI family thioesterase [Mycobacterium sp. ITM-2016-00317]